MSSTWPSVRQVFCRPETDFAVVHHSEKNHVTIELYLWREIICESSNQILSRQIVNFIFNFWPLSSQKICKSFYTYTLQVQKGVILKNWILLQKIECIRENFHQNLTKYSSGVMKKFLSKMEEQVYTSPLTTTCTES